MTTKIGFSLIPMLFFPLAAAAESRVHWQENELTGVQQRQGEKFHNLKAAAELFHLQQVGLCHFTTSSHDVHETPEGAFESLRLHWYAPESRDYATLEIGLTQGHLADQTFSRSVAPVTIHTDGVTPLFAVHYSGRARVPTERMDITAFVDAHDEIYRVTSVKRDDSFPCAGIRLGAICIGVDGVGPSSGKVIFNCHR